jgi:transposase
MPSSAHSARRADPRRYTGGDAADAAAEHGIDLHVIKRPEGERGFVLLPRRWVVERSFGWMSRFRRLARDYERLSSTAASPASTSSPSPLSCFAALLNCSSRVHYIL